MCRKSTKTTRTETLFPYTARIRSVRLGRRGQMAFFAPLREVESVFQDTVGADPRHHRFLHDDFAVGAREYLARSEEHTSELQSLMRISYAVFCLPKNKRNYQ